MCSSDLIRLGALGLTASPSVQAALKQPTQRLLRRHEQVLDPASSFIEHSTDALFMSVADPIGARMRAAAERRIPAALVKAHLDGIATGQLTKETLAWLLETPAEELEVDEPGTVDGMSIEEMAADLGLVGS